MPTQEGLFLIFSTSDRFAVAYRGAKSPCVSLHRQSRWLQDAPFEGATNHPYSRARARAREAVAELGLARS